MACVRQNFLASPGYQSTNLVSWLMSLRAWMAVNHQNWRRLAAILPVGMFGDNLRCQVHLLWDCAPEGQSLAWYSATHGRCETWDNLPGIFHVFSSPWAFMKHSWSIYGAFMVLDSFWRGILSDSLESSHFCDDLCPWCKCSCAAQLQVCCWPLIHWRSIVKNFCRWATSEKLMVSEKFS